MLWGEEKNNANNDFESLQEKRNYFIGVLDIAGFEIFDVSIFDKTKNMLEQS